MTLRRLRRQARNHHRTIFRTVLAILIAWYADFSNHIGSAILNFEKCEIKISCRATLRKISVEPYRPSRGNAIPFCFLPRTKNNETFYQRISVPTTRMFSRCFICKTARQTSLKNHHRSPLVQIWQTTRSRARRIPVNASEIPGKTKKPHGKKKRWWATLGDGSADAAPRRTTQ